MMKTREIQIRRRETKNYLPGPITAESKKYLSSVYVGRAPLKGLEKEEEKEILADHFGMDVSERNFHQVCREFWADLRLEVPMEGVTLNISTDDKGKPYDVMDYIYYNFAQKHPFVGENREDMLSDSTKMFYIFDPDEEVKRVNKTVSFKKKAYEELIKMGEDEVKFDRLLRILSDTNPATMDIKQKQNFMDQLIEQDPEKFVVVATDKHLETKAIISEMVSESILNKMGNQYWFIDEKIGDNIDEAVKYMLDKKNSDNVNRMKAKLQEAHRK